MNAAINNKIVEVFLPYNPLKLGVFGSYSRGEMNSDSDIDILYSLEQTLSLFDLAAIKINLQELLGRKVDIVSEKGLNKYLEPYIKKDLKIIYER